LERVRPARTNGSVAVWVYSCKGEARVAVPSSTFSPAIGVMMATNNQLECRGNDNGRYYPHLLPRSLLFLTKNN